MWGESTRCFMSLSGPWTRRLEGPEGSLQEGALVHLPGMWDEDPRGLAGEAGFVHYDRTFTKPDWPQGGRWVLHLEGVSSYVQVWLNGHMCLHHMGDRQGLEVAVNDLLRPGSNHIHLRVGNLLDASVLPLGSYEKDPESPLGYRNTSVLGQTYTGGVPGDIGLAWTPWTYWRSPSFAWAPQGQGGTLTLLSRPVGPYEEVRACLRDQEGRLLAQNASRPGEDLALDVSPLPLWRPEAPVLYDLVLEAYAGQKLIDRWSQAWSAPCPGIDYGEAGLRPAPLGLYGPQGPDFLPAAWEGQVLAASAYPVLASVLDRADQAGIPLLLGVPFGTLGEVRLDGHLPRDLPAREAAWVQGAFDLIQRAGSHPCVAAWDFACPWPQAKPSQDRIIQGLLAKDPYQRPVII